MSPAIGAADLQRRPADQRTSRPRRRSSGSPSSSTSARSASRSGRSRTRSSSYQRLTEERTALTTAVDANRERLRLSELRYRAGVAAYFEVLDSSRQLFDSELALIQVTAGQYQSVIQLYQALGGGYDASTAAAPSLPATPYSAPRSGAVWWF